MITTSIYLYEGSCDRKHMFFTPRFRMKGENLGACKAKLRKLGWRFHRTGKISCPPCTRPRNVLQEFPGESS